MEKPSDLPAELEARVRALHDEHWPHAQCDHKCSHMERLRQAMREALLYADQRKVTK